MNRDRLKVVFALAAVLVVAGGLAGCGRKGPLDPPPSAVAPPPGAATQRSPERPSQMTPPPQAKKKTFILDPLLQ